MFLAHPHSNGFSRHLGIAVNGEISFFKAESQPCVRVSYLLHPLLHRGTLSVTNV